MTRGPKPIGSLNVEDLTVLKRVIQCFEDAWRQGPRPVIGDYLLGDAALQYHLLIELVHVDLELRLKAGDSARVEEYLGQYPELADDHAAALDLIEAEYQLRRHSEPRLALEEYLQRFPRYRVELPERIDPATQYGARTNHDTPPQSPGSNREAPPKVPGYEML